MEYENLTYMGSSPLKYGNVSYVFGYPVHQGGSNYLYGRATDINWIGWSTADPSEIHAINILGQTTYSARVWQIAYLELYAINESGAMKVWEDTPEYGTAVNLPNSPNLSYEIYYEFPTPVISQSWQLNIYGFGDDPNWGPNLPIAIDGYGSIPNGGEDGSGAVPEPFSIGLLLSALGGLVLRWAKKA